MTLVDTELGTTRSYERAYEHQFPAKFSANSLSTNSVSLAVAPSQQRLPAPTQKPIPTKLISPRNRESRLSPLVSQAPRRRCVAFLDSSDRARSWRGQETFVLQYSLK